MKHSTLLISLLLPVVSIAQSEFVRTYDQLTDNTSIAYSVKQTNDGGFISIGSTNNELNPDIFMIKTNASGGAEWAKQFSGVDHSLDVALDITLAADGGYIFCGNSDNRRILWKVDETGNDVWNTALGDAGTDAYTALTPTRDGGFVAVGDGMVVTKIDSDGRELWTRNKPTEHVSAYRTIKELPNGDLLIGGFFTARDEGKAITILVKTDSEGKAIWAETYGAGIINAVDTDDPGNIWVAGNASYAVPIVLKIGSNGKAIWEGMYEEGRMGSAHSIVVKDVESAMVFTAAGYILIDKDGKLLRKENTPDFGFNKAFISKDGDLIMAGFCDESISGYEKFTFLKMEETGFPSPTASTQ